MIDFFMQPFFAPSTAEALQAMAATVNHKEGGHAIQTSPHHFEVWEICEITENGEVKGEKHLIAECSGLVRGGFRSGEAGDAGTGQGPIKSGARTGPAGANGGGAATNGHPPQSPPTAAHIASQVTREEPH